MTLNKFVFKTHKWTAVGIGVITVIWFVSGVVIVLPSGILSEGPAPQVNPHSVDFREVSITVPQAIAAAEAAAGKPIRVSGMGIRHWPGRLLYEVQSDAGTFLIDARSGERFEITEDAVRQMLAQSRPNAPVQQISLLKEHVVGYSYGPLPVYWVRMGDAAETHLYIARDNGQIQSSNRLGRFRALFHDLHNFSILRGYLSGRMIRLLLILTSVVGTLMSLFGMWILWIQLKMWWNVRQARAA